MIATASRLINIVAGGVPEIYLFEVLAEKLGTHYILLFRNSAAIRWKANAQSDSLSARRDLSGRARPIYQNLESHTHVFAKINTHMTRITFSAPNLLGSQIYRWRLGRSLISIWLTCQSPQLHRAIANKTRTKVIAGHFLGRVSPGSVDKLNITDIKL